LFIFTQRLFFILCPKNVVESYINFNKLLFAVAQFSVWRKVRLFSLKL